MDAFRVPSRPLLRVGGREDEMHWSGRNRCSGEYVLWGCDVEATELLPMMSVHIIRKRQNIQGFSDYGVVVYVHTRLRMLYGVLWGDAFRVPLSPNTTGMGDGSVV